MILSYHGPLIYEEKIHLRILKSEVGRVTRPTPLTLRRRATLLRALQGLETEVCHSDTTILPSTIIPGLQVYSDRSLGANLLYRFERPSVQAACSWGSTGLKALGDVT